MVGAARIGPGPEIRVELLVRKKRCWIWVMKAATSMQ